MVKLKEMVCLKLEFNKDLILQENTVVHCDTEEKANNLLKWADSIGLKWRDGMIKYTESDWYQIYKEHTCYDLFQGLYSEYNHYKAIGYKILSYEEVLLSENINSKKCEYDLSKKCNGNLDCSNECFKENTYKEIDFKLDRIFELSNKEPKTLTQKVLKLAEECGEVAQAVLSLEDVPDEYKNKDKEDVLKECIDVLLIINSMLFTEFNKEEIEKSLNEKINKWESKINNFKKGVNKK